MAVNVSMIRDTKWLTLEVCREYQRGTCSRSDAECKFAHPSRSCHVENGRVIACFDSLKSRCTRENCKYLHPPPHLKTQLEINGRNNLIQQKTAAAMLAQQMQYLTVWCTHHSYLLVSTNPQALPPGALQHLPKRPALEKANGATAMFNPSVFHYQHALANMQLQQPTFIPAVALLHGTAPGTLSATTAPTVNSPFAPTANQMPILSIDDISNNLFVTQM
ncbi:muscleblind-like protein 1 [Amblyraja radiata]|uniref:muscleblind-like protein 1 n=1 Tax=Amblyraja radiata TaxID=386614 RepID=UPI001403B6CE|nr:muscleblind-like protein 1 [Amblyraja radiata]